MTFQKSMYLCLADLLKKLSKGRLSGRDKLQNHTNEGKGKEKKKRASRKKGGEEKKHGCTLGFYKGYFGVFGRKKKCWIQKVHFSGGNGFKNPARCTVMYVSLIDL